MGPCKPGQVGNEAAISSPFQVRGASHRGPATRKKLEIQILKSETSIKSNYGIRQTVGSISPS